MRVVYMRVHTHTYAKVALLYLYIFPYVHAGTPARAGQGSNGGVDGKREDGARARGGATKVQECYINRSGQCCYGNTTYSHRGPRGWREGGRIGGKEGGGE